MKSGSLARMLGVILKDAAEVSRNPGVIVPAVITALASLVPAFLVTGLAPALSGEQLADSSDFSKAAAVAAESIPELRGLDGNALVQAFVFHQFLVFLLIVPTVAAMAVAAHAIIGEKTARTLEPLLATPIETTELLMAKAAVPLLFALVLMWTTLLLHLAGVAIIGEPGVLSAVVGPRLFLLFCVLGPLVSLVSLQLAVIVSSRVNDPRSAQQLSALVILPVTAVFIAQLVGQFVLGIGALAFSAAGLAVLNAGLVGLGIRVFDRETILMKWK